MSTTSSPRIPISSPDLSRRRLPRAKDKRRALRDFYGLKHQSHTEDGPVEYDSLLDGPNFSVSSYLVKVNQNENEASDVKNLLKLENRMIREIRVLDGERKALVYDNYDKMISATTTIKHVTTEMQPMTKETFSPILASITQLTSDIDEHQRRNGQSDVDGEDPEEAMREWIEEGPERVKQLIDAGLHKIAQDELDDVVKEVHNLDESRRKKIQDELDSMSEMIKEVSTEEDKTNKTQETPIAEEPAKVSE